MLMRKSAHKDKIEQLLREHQIETNSLTQQLIDFRTAFDAELRMMKYAHEKETEGLERIITMLKDQAKNDDKPKVDPFGALPLKTEEKKVLATEEEVMKRLQFWTNTTTTPEQHEEHGIRLFDDEEK